MMAEQELLPGHRGFAIVASRPEVSRGARSGGSSPFHDGILSYPVLYIDIAV